MSESSARPSMLSRLRSRFTALWLAPVLAIVALGSWAFASPLASSPDDDFHLASIWCAGTLPSSQCELGVSVYHAVPVALIRAPCFAHDEEASAACQAQFLADPSTAQTNRANFNHNYPPVYYAVMSLFASPAYEASALVMRFVTILLFVALTTALFLLLPLRLRGPLIWGWLITTVPLGLFLLASNNPSAWALIGVGSAWLALLGYLETEGRRRLALAGLLLLSSLMAAGSRADAGAYLVLTFGIVVVLTARRERRYLLSLILPAVVSVGAFLFAVGTQQAAVSNTGLSDHGAAPSAGEALSPFALIAYNLLNIPQLWAGIFTEGDWGLGWLDTTMPAVVTIGALAVFAGVAFSGLRAIWWRKAIAVLLLVATLWLLPAYILVRGGNAVGENVQPRYLLPLVIVIAALMMLERRDPARTLFNRFQLAVIIAALAVANSIALHTNIRRYVTGTDQPGVNLDAHPEWWWDIPISPMGVWVVGTLSFTALIVLLARSIESPRVPLS